MTFGEKTKDFLDQGVTASKEFALKAGAKAKDLGERGVLMLEIKQLEGQAEKLFCRLGNDAYRAFVEGKQDSFEKNTPEIQAMLTEITKVREAINVKEADLRDRRN